MKSKLVPVTLAATAVALMLAGCTSGTPSASDESTASSSGNPIEVLTPSQEPTVDLASLIGFDKALESKIVKKVDKQYTNFLGGNIGSVFRLKDSEGNVIAITDFYYSNGQSRISTTNENGGQKTIKLYSNGTLCERETTKKHPDSYEGDMSAKWVCRKGEDFAITEGQRLELSSPVKMIEATAQGGRLYQISEWLGDPRGEGMIIKIYREDGTSDGNLIYLQGDKTFTFQDTISDGNAAEVTLTKNPEVKPINIDDLDTSFIQGP